MSSETALTEALDRLRQTSRRIRDLEAEARRLAAAGNVSGHRRLMVEKTETLTGLPAALSDLMAALPPAQARQITDGAKDFARRAGQALAVGSPFYMSSLLYPDDYVEGEPNDLERFIAELAGEA